MFNFLHTPGIEPEATAWKAAMLPLHHACYKDVNVLSAGN